ncbi:MAG TPA: tetratricopeptide repeat protein, partial [Desulfuromonadaceae bacterium]|nr:tetratricopeptide repeat protein [Desulfuromonadaceae bacterium]
VNVLEPPPKVAPPPPPPKPAIVTPVPVSVPTSRPPANVAATMRTNPPAPARPPPPSGVVRSNAVQVVKTPPEPAVATTVSPDNNRVVPPRNAMPIRPNQPPAPKSSTTNAALAWPPPPKPEVRVTPPAAPPVNFPRYGYLSPHKPPAGNRKAAASAFAEAHRYEQAQQYTDALNSYQTATAIDPAWFDAQYNYGVLAFRQGDYNRALAADEMALAIQPESVDARYNFALALKGAGYAPDAANELKKILVDHPDDVRAHLALGNLYAQQLGDNAQARLHYLRVLALDPANARAPFIQYWLSANPP